MERMIKEQYEKDAMKYSWYYGNHPGIEEARRRCRTFTGLEDVLLSLVHFDPSMRMSYEVCAIAPLLAVGFTSSSLL